MFWPGKFFLHLQTATRKCKSSPFAIFLDYMMHGNAHDRFIALIYRYKIKLFNKETYFQKVSLFQKYVIFGKHCPKTQWKNWGKLLVWKVWNMNRNYVFQFDFLSKLINLNWFFRGKRGHENRFKAFSNHLFLSVAGIKFNQVKRGIRWPF